MTTLHIASGLNLIGKAILLAGIANATALLAQSPQTAAFEVASVKPAAPAAIGGTVNFVSAMSQVPWHGRLRIPAFPLQWLIMLAYDVREFQVLGGPSWVRSDRYEINAKTDSNATFAQMRPMMQSLLAERFKLALRRETRELPV